MNFLMSTKIGKRRKGDDDNEIWDLFAIQHDIHQSIFSYLQSRVSFIVMIKLTESEQKRRLHYI